MYKNKPSYAGDPEKSEKVWDLAVKLTEARVKRQKDEDRLNV
jgi:hypothetical protein